MALNRNSILALLAVVSLVLFPVHDRADALPVVSVETSESLRQFSPPDPELVRRLQLEGKTIVEPSQPLQPRESGADGTSRAPSGPVRPAGRVLAILYDYPDQPGTIPASSFQEMLFGTGAGSLRDYYRVQSNGLFDLTGDVIDGSAVSRLDPTYNYPYVRLSHPKAYYAEAGSWTALEEALRILEEHDFDFAPYASANGAKIPYVFAIRAGYGEEASGDPTDTWSHMSYLWDVSVISSGKIYEFERYIAVPEKYRGSSRSNIGIFAHEFGHVLGLPDLYDTTYVSAGNGDWTLMASGSWNGGGGSVPAMLDAFSRSELGWVRPTVVSSSGSITLPQMEDSGGRAYRIDISPFEYLLVENRQLTGYDRALPGSGLLIWRIDTRITSPNTLPRMINKVNSLCSEYYCPDHYGVLLLEADGRFDLLNQAYYSNQGEASDPFPGTSNVRLINGSTVPSTDTYEGTDSGVTISSISANGATMTAMVTLPSIQMNVVWAGPKIWSPRLTALNLTATVTVPTAATLQMIVMAPDMKVIYQSALVTAAANQPHTFAWNGHDENTYYFQTSEYTVTVTATVNGTRVDMDSYVIESDSIAPQPEFQFEVDGVSSQRTPEYEYAVRSRTPTLVGYTEPGDFAYMNGVSWQVDANGVFRIPLSLLPGRNYVEVKMVDPIGNEQTYGFIVNVFTDPLTATLGSVIDGQSRPVTVTNNNYTGLPGQWKVTVNANRAATWVVKLGTSTVPAVVSTTDNSVTATPDLTAVRGAAVLQFVGRDYAGWETTVSVPIYVDAVGPNVVVSHVTGVYVPSALTVTANLAVWFDSHKKALIYGTATDSGAGATSVKVVVQPPGGAAATRLTVPVTGGYFSLAPLLEYTGQWKLTFTGVDRLGNEGTPVTVTVVVPADVYGPVFSDLVVSGASIGTANLVSVGNTPWQQAGKKVSLTGRAADAGVGTKPGSVTISLKSPLDQVTGPFTITPTATWTFSTTLDINTPGLWTVTLTAQDRLDQVSTRVFQVNVLPDREKPVIKLQTLGSAPVPTSLIMTLPAADWAISRGAPVLAGTATDLSGLKELTILPPGASTPVTVTPGTNGAFTYAMLLPATGSRSYVIPQRTGSTTPPRSR
jgi:M6 family metalloprotease-like protein